MMSGITEKNLGRHQKIKKSEKKFTRRVLTVKLVEKWVETKNLGLIIVDILIRWTY